MSQAQELLRLFFRLPGLVPVMFVLAFAAACADRATSDSGPSDEVHDGIGALDTFAPADLAGDVRSDADATPDACEPRCANRECGADGCGGSCGSCAAGRLCSPDALCVPDPHDCTQTCASLGQECGEHCGELCGACSGAQDACEDGRCVCQPACPVEACGGDDGCGGTCAPCPVDTSCATCPLRLTVVERETIGGALRFVTIALDYAPGAAAERPGMADLRLRVAGPAALKGVALGEAVLAAHKSLYIDAFTGKPYRTLADGSLQFLVLSTANSDRIEPGRWLFFRFALPAPPEGGAPFEVSLVKREQTLAPPPADQALWGYSFDAPVVVWPEVAP